MSCSSSGSGAPLLLGPGVALLVVDMQRDFLDAADGSAGGPAGALPVPGARALLPLVNSLMAMVAAAGGTVVTSQDWHPQVRCCPASAAPCASGCTWALLLSYPRPAACLLRCRVTSAL